jgi:hypothetical protein
MLPNLLVELLRRTLFLYGEKKKFALVNQKIKVLLVAV